MPTHALLGATGGTGAAILRSLQSSQPTSDFHLNVVVRNKQKLLAAYPDLDKPSATGSHLRVTIVEASLDNQEALQQALAGVEVIYSCIGTNTSSHGTSVAIDAARAIISALKSLKARQSSSYIKPTILMLRSANLAEVYAGPDPLRKSWNPVIMALYYAYSDLDTAAKLYEATCSAEPDLLQYIFVDPVSIHDPQGTEGTGYKLSTTEAPKTAVVGYADLGLAFCEIARRKEEFVSKAVMVSATGKVRQSWPPLIANIVGGAVARIAHFS